jgi:hypothetical protein
MDKKLKPDVFWAINSNKYDTYMVSSRDRISFKCEDLYRFMEDYAQLRLSAVSGSFSQKDMENFAAKCMILGHGGKTTEELLKDFCDNDR